MNRSSARTKEQAAHDWVGTLSVEILKGASPELSIKVAYDFGRNLRIKGGREDELPALLTLWVATPFGESPLLRYIRAGFIAGYNGQPLPWKRQIASQQPSE